MELPVMDHHIQLDLHFSQNYRQGSVNGESTYSVSFSSFFLMKCMYYTKSSFHPILLTNFDAVYLTVCSTGKQHILPTQIVTFNKHIKKPT